MCIMTMLSGPQLFCVAMVLTGTTVLGLPPLSKCQLERNQILGKSSTPLVGAFVPECDSNGQYTPEQHWGSTGESWCVNVNTGQEIPNTRTPPGGRPVDCRQPADQGRPLTCQQQRNQLLGWRGEVAPGAFFPKCDNNGLYTAHQCYGFSGFCWCVDPTSGQEVPNTRNGYGEKPFDCSRLAGEALQCHSCTVVIPRPGCVVDSVEQCAKGVNRCATYRPEGAIDILTKGCMTASDCAKDPSAKCCSTNLCN